MKDLIDYEIIWPGEDVLSVEYKGNVTYATLLPEGHILCKVYPCPHIPFYILLTHPC